MFLKKHVLRKRQALKKQALQKRNLFFQIYGDGSNTRSFQYVSDLVDGLIKLMNSNYTGPVNIGNPIEHTIQGKVIFSDICGLFVSVVEKIICKLILSVKYPN